MVHVANEAEIESVHVFNNNNGATSFDEAEMATRTEEQPRDARLYFSDLAR